MKVHPIHPLIPEFQESLRQGHISRREFLRLSTLLGLSLTGATLLAACAPAQTPPPTAPPPRPSPTPLPAIIRGGKLTAAARVDAADHPVRFSLVSQSHPWRHVFDYLTRTDARSITLPYLLDRWEVSDDLKTWKLHLRKGIKFSNGRELSADDVLFNFSQWLNTSLNSSLVGAMDYLDPNGQEKLDPYTVVCHLNKPSIFLPEHLFHYAAVIVPASFGGDIVREPIGTGAFTLKEFAAGERCRLVRREGYWRNGADGAALPYLDEIVMLQIDDPAKRIEALRTRQVDIIVEPPITVWEALKDDPRLTVTSTPTAATRVLRMRVDQDPWKDNRVRQALKYCHNRVRILAEALRGQGVIGNDSHVSPAQPEYVDVAPYPFDPQKSKALLREAGFANGLTVELVVSNEWPESLTYAQILKEDAAAGGFTIQLKPVSASAYWEQWTDWNLGITWWAHRQLAPMMLAAAYTRDASGKPVPWNETRWSDNEFESLLHKAGSTLDLAARREIVGEMEKIMKERGSICLPFFMNVWQIYDKALQGVAPSPTEFAIFHETWKKTGGN